MPIQIPKPIPITRKIRPSPIKTTCTRIGAPCLQLKLRAKRTGVIHWPHSQRRRERLEHHVLSDAFHRRPGAPSANKQVMSRKSPFKQSPRSSRSLEIDISERV